MIVRFCCKSYSLFASIYPPGSFAGAMIHRGQLRYVSSRCRFFTVDCAMLECVRVQDGRGTPVEHHLVAQSPVQGHSTAQLA